MARRSGGVVHPEFELGLICCGVLRVCLARRREDWVCSWLNDGLRGWDSGTMAMESLVEAVPVTIGGGSLFVFCGQTVVFA